jgi:hypothetical protein
MRTEAGCKPRTLIGMSTTGKSSERQAIARPAARAENANTIPSTHVRRTEGPSTDGEHPPVSDKEWLEKACFRATYRTLQNDAEYAKFDQQLQRARKEVERLREAADAAEQKLAAIENSRGYRLLQKCRGARLMILPPGSRRERLAAALYRALRPAAAPGNHRGPVASDIGPVGTDTNEQLTTDKRLSPADLNGATLSDSDADWQLGCEGIRFSPADWKFDVANREIGVPGSDPRSDDRFIKLIILSVVHRAGSTLLQRLCNSRKGTLVWGEHGGVLQHYADIYASAAYFSAAAAHERVTYFEHQEDPNHWIANMTPELEFVQRATVESARTFFNNLYAQYRETHDIIGFKEVRYVRGEIELLRKCYPEASILLLFRDPRKTWNSTPREWYPSFDAWVSKWNRNAKCFLDFAEHDSHCHLLRYENLIRQERATIDMLTDVAKITPEQISAVMSRKIGSAHWGITDAEREMIVDQCREPMARLGYLE